MLNLHFEPCRYDIYDNCPGAAEWFEQAGKSPRWLKTFLRTKMNEQGQLHHATVAQELSEVSGGYVEEREREKRR